MKFVVFAFSCCLLVGLIYASDNPSDQNVNEDVAPVPGNALEANNNGEEQAPQQPELGNNNEEQPADSNNEEQPADSNGEEQPADSNNEEQPADSNGEEQPADSNNEEQPADSNGEEQPADSNGEEEAEPVDIWEEIRMGELNYTYVNEFIEIVNNLTDFKMVNFTLTSLEDFLRGDEGHEFMGHGDDFMGRDHHFSRFEDEFRRRESRHPSRFQGGHRRRQRNDDDGSSPEDRYDNEFESPLMRSRNDTDSDDLQIYYAFGHYTCVFYNASLETVFVYEKNPHLSEGIKGLINVRYPGAKIEFVSLHTKERQRNSSGILSVAYATAIIFGHDPANILVQIDEDTKNKTETLRTHFHKILVDKQLEMFPFEIYDPVWEEIRRGEIYDDYLYEFMQIVENCTDYKMINPAVGQVQEFLRRPQNETHLDDMQILLSKGHYAFVFYNASTETVFIYDRNKILCAGIRELVDIRYPYARVQFRNPRTPQPDNVACGVMTVAYATAIILGEDPTKIKFKLDEGEKNKTVTLRRHFRKILAEKRLEMFPSE